MWCLADAFRYWLILLCSVKSAPLTYLIIGSWLFVWCCCALVTLHVNTFRGRSFSLWDISKEWQKRTPQYIYQLRTKFVAYFDTKKFEKKNQKKDPYKRDVMRLFSADAIIFQKNLNIFFFKWEHEKNTFNSSIH